MNLRETTSPADLEAAFQVIKELRPHLSIEDSLALYHNAREKDGYTLVGFFDGQLCLGAMGYRILFDFAHGRHLYVDDLVVLPDYRSKGIGEKLLQYAESTAQKLNCQNLRLCTGIQNTKAQKFYERCGWTAKSVAYKKQLK